MTEYSYCLTFGAASPAGEWLIYERGKPHWAPDANVVFRFPYHESHDDEGQPPAEVRAEYERLIGYVQGAKQAEPFNIVEMVAGDDCAFDQPCAHGHRVQDHAVYCHNTDWLYAPRKCRRRQADSVWGEAWPHEKCAGFKANPLMNK